MSLSNASYLNVKSTLVAVVNELGFGVGEGPASRIRSGHAACLPQSHWDAFVCDGIGLLCGDLVRPIQRVPTEQGEGLGVNPITEAWVFPTEPELFAQALSAPCGEIVPMPCEGVKVFPWDTDPNAAMILRDGPAKQPQFIGFDLAVGPASVVRSDGYAPNSTVHAAIPGLTAVSGMGHRLGAFKG